MRRLLTASVLLSLALLATAAGQPQPGLAPKAVDDKKTDKKLDPTDAAVAAALANDPDVRMAKAKIQLAEAELAKARQVTTLRVLTLKAKIEQLKGEVRTAEDRVALIARSVEKGVLPSTQLLAERDKLEAAKAALAAAEAEWKLLTGSAADGPVSDLTNPNASAIATAMRYLQTHQNNTNYDAERLATFLGLMALAREREAVKGPIPDRLRAALDKPVKLGAKGEKITFEKALEVFKKEAGLDVPVRGTYPVRVTANPKNPTDFQNHPIEVVLEGEEMSVGAWFQLFEDNAVSAWSGRGASSRFRFYVREYGLLISSAADAPPDAPSLTEFWKQKPPAKEPKTDPQPKM